MPRKIIPTLIAPVSLGQVENAFNPPVEQKIVAGSEAWYKKKEANSGQYIQDLIYRIQTGQGSYGKSKYKKDYAVDEIVIDKQPKKIVTKNITKLKENVVKERIKKWKQLFKDNQIIDKQKGREPTKAPQKHPNVKKVPVKKVETSRKTSAKHPQKPTNDCPEGHTFVKAHCRKNYVKKNKGV